MKTIRQKQNRNAVVVIRMAPAEKKQLRASASENGSSISGYLRTVLKGLKPVDYATRQALIGHINQQFRVLHGLGNNINQLTHTVHLIKKGFKKPAGEIQELHVLLSYNLKMLQELGNSFSQLLKEITAK